MTGRFPPSSEARSHDASTDPLRSRAQRVVHRALGVALFLGGGSVLVVALVLLERREWTEADLYRVLPLAGIVSVFFLIGLLIQVAFLLQKRTPDQELKSKVLYSIIFGGPLGLLWSVFLLTRPRDETY
jgi:formate-dependent nitrite reductase membrane component NrfD